MGFALFYAPKFDRRRRAANTPAPVGDSVIEETEIPGSQRGSVVGICGGARVTTDFGLVPASLLRPGDCVQTVDGRFVRVRRVRKIAFDTAFLKDHATYTGIVIEAGALGGGLPRKDICVAPDQPIFGADDGTGAGFTQAAALLGRAGIRQADLDETTYYSPEFETPAELMVEGARGQF